MTIYPLLILTVSTNVLCNHLQQLMLTIPIHALISDPFFPRLYLYPCHLVQIYFFFFSSRRRHTRYWRDWSSDVCSSDLTLVLVLITLFGALPMYRRVAEESPHGDGSISMLERLLDRWKGKLFVLCLIGFVATGFVITITLSAADATAHLAENPFTRSVHGREVAVTLALIALLGAVFLKGFGEAIGVAVVLVAVYI